jgi:hypothetical protein
MITIKGAIEFGFKWHREKLTDVSLGGISERKKRRFSQIRLRCNLPKKFS